MSKLESWSFLLLAYMALSLNVAALALELSEKHVSLRHELTIKGATDLAHDYHKEDSQFGRVFLKSQAQSEGFEHLDAKASFKVDYMAAHDGEDYEDKEFRLWEAYATYKSKSFEFSIGRKILRWGKTDEFSPVDNVNPQDLRELVYQRLEDRKRPVFMGHVRFFRGDTTVEAVFSPGQNHHTRDFLGTDWAVLGHTLEQFVDRPSKILRVKSERHYWSFRDSEAGLRVTSRLDDVDLGASFLYAHDRSLYPAFRGVPFKGLEYQELIRPEIQRALLQSPISIPIEIEVEYPRDSIVGLEFESVLGDWGVRGEVAYHTGRVFLKKDLSYVQKEQLQYVLGIDRFFENNIYLNLQFFQQYIFGYQNSILFDPRVDTGITLRTSYPFWNDKYEVFVDGFYSIRERMWYLNPELRWKPADGLIIFLGLHLIDGDKGSFFHLYDGNDEFYMGLKLIH